MNIVSYRGLIHSMNAYTNVLPLLNFTIKKSLPKIPLCLQLNGNHTFVNYNSACLIKLQKPRLLDKKYNSESLQQHRGYAMRLELTEYGIIWKRPDPVPMWRPEKAGDLIPFEEVDQTKPVLEMNGLLEEIAKSDERTQRLLSVEFSNDKEVLKMAKYKMKRRIQRHQLDEKSPEVIIATMTVEIRYLQKKVAANKKLLKERIRLQNKVYRRRKELTNLRKEDYKRFEWLLEELSIIYRPEPPVLIKISRRESLRKLVEMHCEKLIRDKMEEYREEMEPLKRPFLKEKRETLTWIAETEKKLGLPVSVKIPDDDEDRKLLEGGTALTSQQNDLES